MSTSPSERAASRPSFVLAVALAGAGAHAAAWRAPGADPRELATLEHWTRAVRGAEQASATFATIEDDPSAGARPASRASVALDATMVACAVAPRTTRVGIVPAVSTTLSEPFIASSQLATLDHVSRGRGGWLVRPAAREADAGYVGPRPVPAAAAVSDEAVEVVEVVRELWDSWEDDAEIRDVQAHRFIDRDRIHHVRHEGAALAVAGPSITPRPPQGQPVVVVRATTPEEDAFAATVADVVCVAAADEDGLPARIDAVRVLVDVVVHLDASPGGAAGRRDELDALAGAPRGIVVVGTPQDVADRLAAWRAHGIDGVRLWPATIPHDLDLIAGPLADALRGRGLLDADPPAGTLRDRLGLARPANRYAA